MANDRIHIYILKRKLSTILGSFESTEWIMIHKISTSLFPIQELAENFHTRSEVWCSGTVTENELKLSPPLSATVLRVVRYTLFTTLPIQFLLSYNKLLPRLSRPILLSFYLLIRLLL